MGLLSQFGDQPLVALLSVLALIISIGFHEFSHVLVAYVLGDQTGRLAGRLTLNPLRHLDPIGLFAILLLGVGWGKPAPFNPESLRYRRFGPSLVALGGPLSNILLVAIFGLLWRLLLPSLGSDNLLTTFLWIAIFFNAALAVFNLLPIPPLDGSHLLRSLFGPQSGLVRFLDQFGWQLLIALIVIGSLTGGGFLASYLRAGISILLRIFGLSG